MLANPWRYRILDALGERPLSATEFLAADQGDGDISTIARQFRRLAQLGYIEVVEQRTGGRRRGGVETIYRRIKPVQPAR